MSVCSRAVVGALLATSAVMLGGCSGSAAESSHAAANRTDTSDPTSAPGIQTINDGDLTGRILHDEPWLRAHGVALVEWGPCGLRCSPATKERVVVYHLTPTDVELLDQRYGAGNLEVVNSDVPSLNDLNPPIPRH